MSKLYLKDALRPSVDKDLDYISSKDRPCPTRLKGKRRLEASGRMIDLPSEDDIIQLNKEILQTIRVKRADMHKVVKKAAITQAIESAKKDQGDLYDKVATLLINLVQGHPFDSGNRRTAFATAKTVLKINGEDPKVVHNARVLQGIREGFYTKDEIKKWLKGYGIRAFSR